MQISQRYLRPLGTLDVDAVWQLESAAQKHGWTRQSLLEAFLCGNRVMGIWENQTTAVATDKANFPVATVLAYSLALQAVDEVQLLNIAVVPQAQKQGLAECLLRDLNQWASALFCQKITLEVRKSNAAAIALYQKMGYQMCAERKNYYADAQKEDALIMVQTLTAKDRSWLV